MLFDLDLAVAGARFPYRWFDDYHARVGLLPRAGNSTEVLWHEVAPCYVFHTMNAYDEGAGIVLDVASHDSMFRTQLSGPPKAHRPSSAGTSTDGAVGSKKSDSMTAARNSRGSTSDSGRNYSIGFSVSVMTQGDILGTESGLIRHDLGQHGAVPPFPLRRYFG